MSLQPQILSSYEAGYHSVNLENTVSRLSKEYAYKDLSCIQIVPAFGSIPTKAVASWLNMFTPPNQKFFRMFAMGMEVGHAFSSTIDSILANPDLSKCKYILTLEHDNIPPPDGIVRLLQKMEDNPEYSAIGGLYFTKGMGGCAQIWGDPSDPVLNFRPQVPRTDGGLQECCGTGMGFTMFKLDMFRDERLPKQLFTTTGTSTQDLTFWMEARKYGYRCAIATDVRVGHYDLDGKIGGIEDFTW
jgi:hypothetical protein